MARKTKKERQADRVAEIDASLPPLDIGQFDEIEPPRNTHYTVVQVLNAGETIIRGATLRDAEFLHGFSRGALRAWQRDARRAERGQQAPLGRWAQACADTVERALAIRRLRWQALAEEGGGGSHAALWMLERRGGKEFHAPAQRHEVTRESSRSRSPWDVHARGHCGSTGSRRSATSPKRSSLRPSMSSSARTPICGDLSCVETVTLASPRSLHQWMR